MLLALDWPPPPSSPAPFGAATRSGFPLNAVLSRPDTSRGAPRPPLREHVAQSVRRYLRDLDGCDADDVVYVDPVPLVKWNRVVSLILPSTQAVSNTSQAVNNVSDVRERNR